MSRPLRTTISEKSLIIMGVSKRFCKYTIDDFKTFNDSKLENIKSFVQAYLNDLVDHVKNGEGIFFYGNNGVGKSMLACIILKEAYRHRFTCKRITFSQYISAYTESWSNKSGDLEYLVDNYKDTELLVLEEVGKEIDSKIAKPILEDLLRYREENGLATITCSNMTLENFRDFYGQSICSLVNGNQTFIKIIGEDRRQEVFNKTM